MAYTVRRVEYYNTTLNERPVDAYEILSALAGQGVSFVALSMFPAGPEITQITMFPEDGLKLVDAARKAGMSLIGPNTALLIQGADEMGVMAKIHRRLHDADVDVFASSAVADGRGFFGSILYVRSPEQADKAAQVLQAI